MNGIKTESDNWEVNEVKMRYRRKNLWASKQKHVTFAVKELIMLWYFRAVDGSPRSAGRVPSLTITAVTARKVKGTNPTQPPAVFLEETTARETTAREAVGKETIAKETTGKERQGINNGEGNNSEGNNRERNDRERTTGNKQRKKKKQ